MSAERKTQLRSQLAAAEKAVKAAQRELAEAEKEAETIRKKQEKLNADKLLPESFQIVRAQPTHAQEMKKLAYEFGYHGESGITIKTGRN